MTSPLQKPEGITWNPATVELPQPPMLPPGQDAMSMTIAAVLPTLTTPLATSVASLQAKETNFAGKVGAAQSAYENADASGGQSVGQISGMLGQMGQMAQQAGQQASGAGQGGGGFGQMMQQAMQAAQGFGQQGGGSAGGGAPSGAPNASPRDEPDSRDDSLEQERERQREGEDRPPAERAPVEPPAAAAGPGAGTGSAGPPPVDVPRQSPGGDEDLARRM
ncbi:hypothetical protein [Mycolicibacterium lacusdiani]|uniref:hypothetical protein n=1 Tax=Mycolicibacterium lacusdiani TaxID=2895283 RepID=UPI001F3B08A8|nr:hypothetical protein [Mycolicibacterium lacusdiani]